MNSTPKTLTLSLALSMLLLCPACMTTRPQINHIPRLLSHPQFQAARDSAPEFTRDALSTINDLQRDIQKEKQRQ